MLFAFVGTAGSVILFVVSGLGVLLLGTYFLCLAAHYYLITVQETAVGLDQVEWPNDSVIDWMGGSLALLMQLLIWVMPAGFLARFLAPVWLPDQPPLRFAILMGLAAWLLFPPGFLLTTASQQAGRVAGRLLLALPSLLVFYLLSGGVCLAGVAVCYSCLFSESLVWLLAAIAVIPMVVLWHARLVGRLGWLIGREEVLLGKQEQVEAEPTAEEERPRPGKRKRRTHAEVHDPWAVPQDEPIEADLNLIEELPQATARSNTAPHEEQPIESYGLAAEEPPPRPALELPPLHPPKPRKRRPPKLEPTAAAEDQANDNRESPVRAEDLQRERRLRQREELPPPRSLFFSGVWEFPLYPASVSALVWMAVYAFGAFGLARFMISVSPFHGGAE
ncbi:MAG: hypothetical protein SNJ82_09700 [Gemmataceae bacterium]